MRHLQYLLATILNFLLTGYVVREMLNRDLHGYTLAAVFLSCFTLLMLLNYYESDARNRTYALRLEHARLVQSGHTVPDES